jgi:hypothetical protein
MATGRTRIGGGIYNPGGENVGQVYKPQGVIVTGFGSGGNIKPKTIKPQESEASKQRKAEAKGQEKLARQKAAAERAEMYRKKTKEEKAIIKKQQTKEELADRRWQERNS